MKETIHLVRRKSDSHLYNQFKHLSSAQDWITNNYREDFLYIKNVTLND